jgi:hypothetical protein
MEELGQGFVLPTPDICGADIVVRSRCCTGDRADPAVSHVRAAGNQLLDVGKASYGGTRRCRWLRFPEPVGAVLALRVQVVEFRGAEKAVELAARSPPSSSPAAQDFDTQCTLGDRYCRLACLIRSRASAAIGEACATWLSVELALYMPQQAASWIGSSLRRSSQA